MTNENAKNTFKVGDILSSSWGYSMTIVSWYQVIKVTPKTITVKEIEAKIIDGNGMHGESIPVPNLFSKRGLYPEQSFTRKVKGDYININESQTAWIWDGNPKYHNHWD